MKEYVWYCPAENSIHLSSIMDQASVLGWLVLSDVDSFQRALEQAEPPIKAKGPLVLLGEL